MAGELQVRQYLSFVNWQQRLNRFVLNNDASGNEHVDSISGVDFDRSILDRQLNFALHVDPARLELICETTLVS